MKRDHGVSQGKLDATILLSIVSCFLYGCLLPTSRRPSIAQALSKQHIKGLLGNVCKFQSCPCPVFPVCHFRSKNKDCLPSVVLHRLSFLTLQINKYNSTTSFTMRLPIWIHRENHILFSELSQLQNCYFRFQRSVKHQKPGRGYPFQPFKRNMQTCHFSHFSLKSQ